MVIKTMMQAKKPFVLGETTAGLSLDIAKNHTPLNLIIY